MSQTAHAITVAETIASFQVLANQWSEYGDQWRCRLEFVNRAGQEDPHALERITMADEERRLATVAANELADVAANQPHDHPEIRDYFAMRAEELTAALVVWHTVSVADYERCKTEFVERHIDWFEKPGAVSFHQVAQVLTASYCAVSEDQVRFAASASVSSYWKASASVL